LGARTSVGLLTLTMAWAMVKVLPDPVTPRRTLWRFPAIKLRDNFLIAWGWSPVGSKFDTNSNWDITQISLNVS